LLAMPVSGDTLLRLIRAVPVEPAPPARVIGIDDWAWLRISAKAPWRFGSNRPPFR
jgi:hypothetical protein